MTRAELRRARAAAQGLARPATGPVEIVRRLLAVQAQDTRAARLALRARGRGFGAADVDAALEDGRLVIAWLMRGTLHLVAREDHGWLLALTAGQAAATSARRLAQLGVRPHAAERAVELVGAAVARGPQTRAELGTRLAAAGIPAEGQALPHLLGLAARRGACVLGPIRDGAPAFVPAPAVGAAPQDPAAELARRYLAAHAAAGAADLAAWSGLPLRAARAGLAAAGDRRRRQAPAHVPPRLLPAFDPYLLGWRDRAFMVAPQHAAAVHPGGGIVRATATADGRAVGTWTLRRGEVEVQPFGSLPAWVQAALTRDAADVERFLRR
jgi:hypothetical protein